MILMCKNCHACKVNRPRGLCWSCYYSPGVKERFPITSKFAVRNMDDFYGASHLPPEPTTAPPGTPEKQAVMARRAQLKQALCHPMDAEFDGDPRPFAELLKRRSALAS